MNSRNIQLESLKQKIKNTLNQHEKNQPGGKIIIILLMETVKPATRGYYERETKLYSFIMGQLLMAVFKLVCILLNWNLIYILIYIYIFYVLHIYDVVFYFGLPCGWKRGNEWKNEWMNTFQKLWNKMRCKWSQSCNLFPYNGPHVITGLLSIGRCNPE